MDVSVRELKNHLSRFIGLAQSGEPVVIHRHKKVVAALVGIAQIADEDLQELMGIPGVTWNGGKPRGGQSRPVIEGRTASDRALEDRG